MILPNYIDQTAWDNFVTMRKQIKKPLTENAKRRAVDNLTRLWQQGEDITMVLNQSEDNCWQGLFPVTSAYKAQQGIAIVNQGIQPKLIQKLTDRSWADDVH
jgi:hypothetical protein